MSVVEETFGQVFICSLSGAVDQPLLWAHYADSHRGLAIEFDCAHRPFSFALRVKYQNEYPSIGYPFQVKEPFDVLATKSDIWEYEEEFRILYNRTSTPPGTYEDQSAVVEKSALKAVYFGAKMSCACKESVVEMIERGPFDPEVYDVSLSRSEYSLDFHQR